jgi:hypothetical protein
MDFGSTSAPADEFSNLSPAAPECSTRGTAPFSVPKASEPPKQLPPSPYDDLVKFARQPKRDIVAKRVTRSVKASPKPPKQKFIRVMPFSASDLAQECENCFPVLLVKTEKDDAPEETYYVLPDSDAHKAFESLEPDLLLEALLVVGICFRSDEPFIWELVLSDGRNEMRDRAADSRMDIAREAIDSWLKPKWVASAGGYDPVYPIRTYPDPDWSKYAAQDLFLAALRKRTIDSPDHPVAQELLGL